MEHNRRPSVYCVNMAEIMVAMSLLTKRLPKIAALAASLFLIGCMTPSPYAPRSERDTTGYTDRSLAQNRYRVTFTGNSATPRETVEGYLLLRAAEVTQAAGYTYFVFDNRNTNVSTRFQATPGLGDPFYGGGYGGFGRRSGFSFGSGFAFGSGGFGSGFGSGVGFGYNSVGDISTRTNYEAYAEIVLLTPEQATQETRALKATDVIGHLRQSGPERRGPT